MIDSNLMKAKVYLEQKRLATEGRGQTDKITTQGRLTKTWWKPSYLQKNWARE